ncbi:MAG TPA: hypothetical protein VMW45_03765 [Dehalococcoidia bacterium]|nr:hypothetical protein [Dehalococcoidia bacterium]
MMNYTKGEWKVTGTGIGDYFIEPLMARVPRINDAQLIASAPDLYEALKAVDDYLSAPYPENMKLKQIAADKLISALAKAEGK